MWFRRRQGRIILLVMGLAAATLIAGYVRTRMGYLAPPGTMATVSGQLMSLIVNAIFNASKFTLTYVGLILIYNLLGIHKRFGIFRGTEPESHFVTALGNWKVAYLWGIGLAMACYIFQINNQSIQAYGHPSILFQLPERYVFLHSPSLATDILYAIVGFYLIDLTDWTAHWVVHQYPYLYRKFPFGHFVHHNVVYVNPTTVFASPLVHLAQISGLIMYVLLLSQGLFATVFFIHILKQFCNFSSHLGCDPLPGLTRLNHRLGGWLPWIPLYHQYHHIPSVKGNYGNITCLWDYVFGTVSPDTIHHIETREATPRVIAIMSNSSGQIDRFMKGKVRLSL